MASTTTTATRATSSKLRNLGPFEQFSSSRHALGIYRRLANTCRYIVPSGISQTLRNNDDEEFLQGKGQLLLLPPPPPSPLLRALFEAALLGVISSQASLRVGIVDEDTQNPYFVPITRIDLAEHLSWTHARHDADLLGILQEEQVKGFDDVAGKPPWRVVVVRYPGREATMVLDVVFLVHHALCDGRSAGRFHGFLRRELDGVVIGEGGELTVKRRQAEVQKVQEMVPAMEQMIEFETSWGFLLRTLWKELGPKWLNWFGGVAEQPWTGGEVSREPHRLHLRKIELSAAQMERLIARCRVKEATLTGLIHGLILLSLSRRLTAQDPCAFVGTTPISLLDLAKAGSGIELDEGFSVAVTGYNHHFDTDAVKTIVRSEKTESELFQGEDAVWKVAHAIRDELRERVATLPKDDIISLLNWVGNWKRFWTGTFGKPRSSTWEVSNIGSLRFPGQNSQTAETSWRIDRSIFSQPVMTVGAAICVNAASVRGGLLTIMLGWQEGIVDKELGVGVKQDLETWLDAMVVSESDVIRQPDIQTRSAGARAHAETLELR